MKDVKRLRRLWLPLTATAVLTAAVITAIAYGAPAGGGAQITTARPAVTSANLVAGDTIAAGQRVNVCFNTGPVNTVVGPGSFSIRGYDRNETATPTSAIKNPGDPNCVILGFPANTDVQAFTVVEALDSAITNLAGNTSLSGASSIDPARAGQSRAGATSGPDLLSAVTDTSNQTITYVFDEPLQPGSAAPGSFQYTTSAGTGAGASESGSGATAIAVGEFSVRISFGAAAPSVNQAVRATAEIGGVTDLQGEDNPIGSIGLVGGGATTSPDLTGADPVAGVENAFDVKFDRPVSTTACGNFLAYTEDAAEVSATGCITPGADASVVRVTFPVGTFGAKVQLVAVAQGAVTDLQGGASGSNTRGVAAVAGRQANIAPGFTDAPDLRQIVIDQAANTARFIYDQRVVTAGGPGLYTLFDANGVATTATSVLIESGTATNQVVATFPTAVLQAAAGGGVAPLAVLDGQGKANGRNTISLGMPTATTGPIPTTTTTGTTGSPTTGTATGTTGTGTGTSGTGTGTSGTGTGTGTTTGTTGKVRPNMVRPSVNARQRGNQIIVRVSGRMVGVRGLPCGGRVKVGLRLANRRRGQRTVRMSSRCRYTATLRTSVRSLPRALRPRRRVILARVTARFGGNSRLLSDLSPTRRARVRR